MTHPLRAVVFLRFPILIIDLISSQIPHSFYYRCTNATTGESFFEIYGIIYGRRAPVPESEKQHRRKEMHMPIRDEHAKNPGTWCGLNRPDLEEKQVDTVIFGIPFDEAVSYRSGG